MIKIPTLLALALIITILGLGVGIYFTQQNSQKQLKAQFAPQEQKIVNLSDTAAAVVWETKEPVVGQIVFGENQFNLNQFAQDNRDRLKTSPHIMHFVTLKNLKPETKYYYQIKNGEFSYPDGPLNFTTAKSIDNSERPQKPIRGTVLDTNLNPIDEALIYLKLDGASDIATFTSGGGNFILPLIDLRTADLSASYLFSENNGALLTVKKGDLSSAVQITLPTDEVLPPITIGQNINLKEFKGTTEKPITFGEQQKAENQFDLNKDGTVNTLDLSFLLSEIRKKNNNSTLDLNKDGKVDDQDAQTLSQAIR